MQAPAGRPAQRPVFWGLAFALASLAGSAIMWGFLVDDALISVRYARHLAFGAGYRFNLHGPCTDGVTPLPWPFVLAPLAHGTALAVLMRVKVLGVALHAVAAALIGVRVGAADATRAVKLVALGLLAVCLPLAAYGPSGMETPVATALCAACVFCMHRPRLAALFAGLCAAVRPELLPWAVTVACGLTLAHRRARVIGSALLLAVAPFGLCAAVRLAAFGRAAPLAVLAKPSDAAHGLSYALAALLAAGVPVTLLAPLALRRAPVRAKTLAVAFVVHVLAVIAAGGDWMPYARLLVPVLPSLMIVVVDVASVSRGPVFWARNAIAMVLSAYVFVAVGPAGRHVMRDRLDLVARASPLFAAKDKIAATDIGWVSAATEADIVDLAGLTDPDFAALPGGHTSKRVDGSMLVERGVDTLVLYADPLSPDDVSDWRHANYAHQVGARLARDPVVAAHFTAVAALPLGTHRAGYVVLSASPGRLQGP